MNCLNIQDRDNFIIVRFSQKCSITNVNASEFAKEVLKHVRTGISVVLDCQNIEIFDSAAISSLIQIRKRVVGNKGRVILVNVGDQIRLLLLITRLHKIFEIHETLEAAIHSLIEKTKKVNNGNPYAIKLAVKNAPAYVILKILRPDSLITANAQSLRKKGEEYIQTKKVVFLNLNVIRNIDSTGIATLIHLKAFAQKRAKRIGIIYNNTVLTQLFELYSLDRLFPHFRTEEEAITALLPAEARHFDKKKPAKPVRRPGAETKSHYDDIEFLSSLNRHDK